MSSVGSIIGNGVGSALKTGMDVGLPAEPGKNSSLTNQAAYSLCEVRLM